jgi:regulator of RNase E activity RraA
VLVEPGDGVVVVSREGAVPVVRAARTVLEADRQARRQLYEEMGRPMDETVRPEEDGGSKP